MYCHVYPTDTLAKYKYVVVLSRYQGKLLLSRHKKRTTWETQGGHIESGESPLDAAKRELYEESGAIRFDITYVFDYRAGDDDGFADGAVYFAEIKDLSEIPDSEMAEVHTFGTLPPDEMLTYPGITPILFRYAIEHNLFYDKEKTV
jgi:8-oxo-dGTP diphosphatase